MLIGLLVVFVGLPPLTRAWWPFRDQYDRLHIGLFLAIWRQLSCLVADVEDDARL